MEIRYRARMMGRILEMMLSEFTREKIRNLFRTLGGTETESLEALAKEVLEILKDSKDEEEALVKLKERFPMMDIQKRLLDKETLFKLAMREVRVIFGRQYLQDNYEGTCTAAGMPTDETYQLFVGIKTKRDLPDREANDKGWVVYAKVVLDAMTGKVVDIEYARE